jgi:pimeloyl-ACP methyl ester carboxylesterase
MPYAVNKLDATRIWFEDAVGQGVPVVVHGGLLDTVDVLRHSRIIEVLDPAEFRVVLVDHRGVGRSDAPHDVESYVMPLRVADALAVLDELNIARAHFIGTSYGARLTFALGENVHDRVLSLVVGGQQPYAIDRQGPLFAMVTSSLARSADEGTLEPFVSALEESAGERLPDDLRSIYLAQDPVAMNAASSMMVAEGAVVTNLGSWRMPCLIFVGENDEDFLDQARRAADEIPRAEFIAVPEQSHMGAHLSHDVVIPAALRTLRRWTAESSRQSTG